MLLASSEGCQRLTLNSLPSYFKLASFFILENMPYGRTESHKQRKRQEPLTPNAF